MDLISMDELPTERVLLVLKPDFRWKGLYWRPNGNGYTNNIMDAGLFDIDGPEVKRSGYAEPKSVQQWIDELAVAAGVLK